MGRLTVLNKARGPLLVAAITTLAAALSACGGESAAGSSPEAVAECLREGGAVVTRQRNEVTAGYYEIASVTKKGGINKSIIRVLLLKDSSGAKFNRMMLEEELSEIVPGAVPTAEAVIGGKAVIGVTPITTASPDAPITSGTFPSEADETLAKKCAAAGVG